MKDSGLIKFSPVTAVISDPARRMREALCRIARLGRTAEALAQLRIETIGVSVPSSAM